MSTVIVLDGNSFRQVRGWLVGSTTLREIGDVSPLMPIAIAGLVVAIVLANKLDVLALGEDVARGLGQNVVAVKLIGIGTVVVLCSIAVASAGPVVFVALAIPHIARSLVGNEHRWVLPYSALLGAGIVVGADTVGRVVAYPGEVPVGVMTSLIGAPVLVLLVRRVARSA